MRKIITKEERQNYLDKFEEWFELVEAEENGDLTFIDKNKNKIYYNASGRTRLISFKLIDESLKSGTRCHWHTFQGAIGKFKKFNIQKIQPPQAANTPSLKG